MLRPGLDLGQYLIMCPADSRTRQRLPSLNNNFSIISENLFHRVPSFVVKPQRLTSDHCQILSWLKSPTELKLKYKQLYDT